MYVEVVVMQSLQSAVLGSGTQVTQLSPQQEQVVPVQRIPPSSAEEEPVYVNPRQYARILKRRLARARLVAMGKIQTERPKYVHESRHRHAMNRVRGEDGRFHPRSMKEKKMMHSKLSTDFQRNTDYEGLGGNNGISHLTGGVAALQLFSRNGLAATAWQPQMMDIGSNHGITTKVPSKSKSNSAKQQKMGRRL